MGRGIEKTPIFTSPILSLSRAQGAGKATPLMCSPPSQWHKPEALRGNDEADEKRKSETVERDTNQLTDPSSTSKTRTRERLFAGPRRVRNTRPVIKDTRPTGARVTGRIALLRVRDPQTVENGRVEDDELWELIMFFFPSRKHAHFTPRNPK